MGVGVDGENSAYLLVGTLTLQAQRQQGQASRGCAHCGPCGGSAVDIRRPLQSPLLARSQGKGHSKHTTSTWQVPAQSLC